MAGTSSFSSSSSSNVSLIPTRPQVFVNFRGKDLRKSFISFLVPALKNKSINVFIDEQEERGKFLLSLFERICESKIALVIFSEGYTESTWCLDELVRIKECMDQKQLIVIPIFYKLDPSHVKRLRGNFGDNFRDLVHRYRHEPERYQKWTEALSTVTHTFALSLSKYSDTSDEDFIRSIVTEVKKVLSKGKYGEIGENDDGCSVPARELAITMYEEKKEEAVEVSVLNELYWLKNMADNFHMRNQSLRPPNEFKFWVMINARELSIEWSKNPDHWTWLHLPNQRANESIVEIAYLRKASWLDVAGKFDTRYLSPWTRYEVVFVVMLQKTTFKWKKPVKLKLVLPSSRENQQERSVYMVDHICNQWVDIVVGEFITSTNNVGEIYFAMYEHKCQLWKSGLFIKCVVIRPKH